SRQRDPSRRFGALTQLQLFIDHLPQEDNAMPFANYKFPEGILDHAKKEEIIHRTTAMFVEYFGEGVRPYSMVLLEEVADGGSGRADETLTLEKMGLPPKTK